MRLIFSPRDPPVSCARILLTAYLALLSFFSFISRLKKSTLHSSSARTKSFWPAFVKQGGRRLGLVTSQEDKYDESNVEDEQADQVSLSVALVSFSVFREPWLDKSRASARRAPGD